jgi:hypothetical protein
LQSGFTAANVSLPLHHVQPFGLYRDPAVYFTVTHKNVTFNNHEQGIEPLRFLQTSQLSSVWQVTSVNRDASGRPFVSTVEPRDPDRFPFYGVQYHPEKNAFEYATWPHSNIPYQDINHSPAAVDFSLHMARFAVDLARRTATTSTAHGYTQPDRFPTVTSFPQKVGLQFEQVYLVPSASYYNRPKTATTL